MTSVALDRIFQATDAPADALSHWFDRETPRASDILLLFSALASAALSEYYLAGAIFREFLGGFILNGIGFVGLAWVYFVLSRALAEFQSPFKRWILAGTYVVTPLHLLLPAAMLALPLGIQGVVLYQLVKFGIMAVLLRRSLAVIQYINQWPAWAALLLFISPFLAALGGLLFFSLVGFLAGLSILLGALA